ncbi:MAG: hypothetical protein ACRDGI_05280 [Candidatus Limnocylindrales bacterium]
MSRLEWVRLIAGAGLMSLCLCLVTLAISSPAPVEATVQSIAIRPAVGSAKQSIRVTFVADACGVLTRTDEIFWDGVPYGIFVTDPPACKHTFSMMPAYGHQQPGRHKLCIGADVLSCATFTILVPKPKPTPKPTLKPTPKSTPGASMSPSSGSLLPSSQEPTVEPNPLALATGGTASAASPTVVPVIAPELANGGSGPDSIEALVLASIVVGGAIGGLLLVRRRRRRER